MSHRAPAGLLLVLALGVPLVAAARTDPSMESLLVALDLERRARNEDVLELERLTSAATRADAAAASARERLVDAVRGGDVQAADLRDEEERVVEAEARAAAAREVRRAAVARLVERVRRIALLQEEVARRRSASRRPADPITGRWEATIDPGTRKGSFRLVLDGTLVSGDYTLDGGFRGSLRGTYVGERITIQRIDSERGFDATFYGRVQPQLKRITGTWEATAIAPAIGPVAGTWSAALLPDDEDGGLP
ncbi:MAG TPA: hypothetical protein PKA62_02465 [Thermoanaerobaculia bacterium]|nr:hypothetical protein [Thermoanaerobaculia bacterium]